MNREDTIEVKWTEFSILIDVGHKGVGEKWGYGLKPCKWKVNGTISGNGQTEEKKQCNLEIKISVIKKK